MTDSPRNTKVLPLLSAYPFAKAHDLENEALRIRNMPVSSSIRRGQIVALFRAKGLLDEFIGSHWPFGATPAGATKLRYYDRLSGSLTDATENQEDESDEGDAGEQRFALESDLRDFLASNLSVLETGLRLYERDGQTGVEFPVQAGFIDILAIDRNNKFVVIELKLSRGRNRALGQLMYYMGWVDETLGNGPCRGYVVASDITDELRVAVRRVAGVSLAKYRIAMATETVDSGSPL